VKYITILDLPAAVGDFGGALPQSVVLITGHLHAIEVEYFVAFGFVVEILHGGAVNHTGGDITVGIPPIYNLYLANSLNYLIHLFDIQKKCNR